MTDTKTDQSPLPNAVNEGTELATTVWDGSAHPKAYMVRPLSPSEGFRRMAMRSAPGATETDEQRQARARAESDVVDAARRSQAEIRRHVDAYLKECLEPIVADVVSLVSDRVIESTLKGQAAMQETQQIQLDRIRAELRRDLLIFSRTAWGKQPAEQARRAKKSKRAKAK